MLFSLAVILCTIFISSLCSSLNQPSNFWFYLQHNFLKEGFFLNIRFIYSWSSLVVESVKSLTAMQETWVRCLGWKDPLEKEMATHSNILTWRIQWTEKPGTLQSMGSQELDTTEWLSTHILIPATDELYFLELLLYSPNVLIFLFQFVNYLQLQFWISFLYCLLLHWCSVTFLQWWKYFIILAFQNSSH